MGYLQRYISEKCTKLVEFWKQSESNESRFEAKIRESLDSLDIDIIIKEFINDYLAKLNVTGTSILKSIKWQMASLGNNTKKFSLADSILQLDINEINISDIEFSIISADKRAQEKVEDILNGFLGISWGHNDFVKTVSGFAGEFSSFVQRNLDPEKYKRQSIGSARDQIRSYFDYVHGDVSKKLNEISERKKEELLNSLNVLFTEING